MENPVQFSLTQLSAEQQARVIALLVQMILHQLSKTVVEGKANDTPNH